MISVVHLHMAASEAVSISSSRGTRVVSTLFYLVLEDDAVLGVKFACNGGNDDDLLNPQRHSNMVKKVLAVRRPSMRWLGHCDLSSTVYTKGLVKFTWRLLATTSSASGACAKATEIRTGYGRQQVST